MENPPTRRPTLRYSVHNLYNLIQGLDAEKAGDALAESQRRIMELKKEISTQSKKNFTLEREIRNLDEKIALLIRNRITFEELLSSSSDLSILHARTITLKDKRERESYGQMFYLLQSHPKYIATLARLVKIGEIDNLLQTVMFTLYGNQYDELEEHLLLSMFQLVLQEEFKQAPGIGSLLRANTALTRMMTTYTRRGPGQQYLKQVLSGILGNICSQNDLILEINPVKVYETYINSYETTTGQTCTLNRKPTPEEAAANEEIKKLIAPRIKRLGEITDKFVDALIGSIEHVPYGIRWICKQIADLTQQKFPNSTQAQLCSLIGGFYLLRFINPAIVTPQAFMLVESKLGNNTRRNLTLLAKILQNLANNMQFGGVKEFYMEPLNVVLQKNKERLNGFLLSLTKVESLDAHLSLDKYLALGKTSESIINISLNEIYCIHELVLQHQHLVCPDSGDPLNAVLKSLGNAPKQIPKTENLNVDLRLYNFAAKDEHNEESNEQLLIETKTALLYIIKMMPQLTPETQSQHNDLSYLLTQATSCALKTSDEEMKNAVSLINISFPKLVSSGVLSSTDGFLQLRKEAIQELTNYEEKVAKAIKDIERLRSVVISIKEHNKFLHQQYDAYKQYLNNVRENCSSGKQAKSDKPKKNRVGPFKYSISQLEKDGIITEASVVPEDKKTQCDTIFLKLHAIYI
eukprot:TRINITY_DN6153_c0_g1_i1.p1 TRINITY_DN6153_c0_g1~~TRINITY_DN6153_c0_g1_i1.p1  ORF type:complete len:704 (-),score=149.43 TRINITY_DN6153_c0_g1_i1:172-2247(-)